MLGYSFGSFVAQSYATRHPAHPGKLVLNSTASRMDEQASLEAFQALAGSEVRAVAAAYFADPTAENRAAYRATCIPIYHRRRLEADVGRRGLTNDGMAIRFSSGEARTMDFPPALGRVACPTLVVAGAQDPRLPLPLARELADGVRPGLARFHVFDGCGHGPHVEEPERVMRLLQEFLLE